MSNYSCSLCDYTTKVKGNITKHIKDTIKCKGAEINTELLDVRCKICDKTFENETYLKQHMKRCFEKRTVVVNNYEDSEHYTKKLEEFSKLIRILVLENTEIKNEVKELRNDNKELTKRIAKLELDKQKYKVIEEDSEHFGNVCDYYDTIQFKPTSLKNFTDTYKANGVTIDSSVDVIINGATMEAIVDDEYLDVDGERYYFDKKEVTRDDLKHISKLKVVMRKYCKESVKYQCDKGCFCEEHKL